MNNNNNNNNEGRKVLLEMLQLVHNSIEACLQFYMSKQEVLNTLKLELNIDHNLTKLVWRRLEEENPEFFRGYHLRLLVIEQIVTFNMLLDAQGKMSQSSNFGKAAQLHQNSMFDAPVRTEPSWNSENMHQPLDTALPVAITNDGSLVRLPAQAALQHPAYANTNDVLPNVQLNQSSNVAMAQGMNVEMIKQEAGDVGCSQFMIDYGDHVVQSCPPSDSSSNSVESNKQLTNETLLNAGERKMSETTSEYWNDDRFWRL